jgi:predicted Zn-dependent protease
MLWIFCIACFLAVGGISYGVLRGRAKEALGISSITKWRKEWVPITLVIDSDFLPEEFAKLSDAVKKASHFWNAQTDLTLFTDIGKGAVVPVMRHDPLTMKDHGDSVAYVALRVAEDGSLKSAAVYMAQWENLPLLILARAMKHELGHCLGLAHDENEFSVMYEKISDRTYCVSPLDKEFLREVYS